MASATGASLFVGRPYRTPEPCLSKSSTTTGPSSTSIGAPSLFVTALIRAPNIVQGYAPVMGNEATGAAPSFGPRAWAARRVLMLVPFFVLHVLAIAAFVGWWLARSLGEPTTLHFVESAGFLGEGAILVASAGVTSSFLFVSWRVGAAGTASGTPHEARVAFAFFALGAFVASAVLLGVDVLTIQRWWTGRLTLELRHEGKLVLVTTLLGVIGAIASPWYLVSSWRWTGSVAALRPERAVDALSWLIFPLMSSRLRLARSPDLLDGERSVLAFEDVHLTTRRLLVLGSDGRPLIDVPRADVENLAWRVAGKERFRVVMSFRVFVRSGRMHETTIRQVQRYDPGYAFIGHVLLRRITPELAKERETTRERASALVESGETILVAVPGAMGTVRVSASTDTGTVLTDRRLFTFDRRGVRANLERDGLHEIVLSESWRGSRGEWRPFAMSSYRGGGRSTTFAFFARALDAYDVLAPLLEHVSAEDLAVVPSPMAHLHAIEADPDAWKHTLHVGV